MEKWYLFNVYTFCKSLCVINVGSPYGLDGDPIYIWYLYDQMWLVGKEQRIRVNRKILLVISDESFQMLQDLGRLLSGFISHLLLSTLLLRTYFCWSTEREKIGNVMNWFRKINLLEMWKIKRVGNVLCYYY